MFIFYFQENKAQDDKIDISEDHVACFPRVMPLNTQILNARNFTVYSVIHSEIN